MTGKLESRADLLNFMRSHPLPAALEEMEELKAYTVDGIAAIWDTFKEPDGSMVRYCIRTHSYASIRIHTHPYASIQNLYLNHEPKSLVEGSSPSPSPAVSIRIHTHSHAFERILTHSNAS